jgi:hypothetical protein
LVSATDANGNLELPTALADVATNVTSTGSTNGIPNYVSLFKKSDGTSYTQVEKVRVDSGSTGNTYFAFHVEDESVKADLSWSETPATGAGQLAQARAQGRRLSAAPGPDFGALNGVDDNGPFGSVTYPLTIDSSAILADILKVQDPSDLTTTMSDPSAASKWLKDNRGDMTWGSRGVMADVKWGGLRRDLSLAFEMDGDDDVTATEQPAKFNQQVGEFVGGTDRLAAPQAALGMAGVKERFLYRDIQGSGTPFAGDLVRGDSVVRGPNWWALRDYANLYKRIRGTGGDYTLDARSYYPNVSAANDSRYNLGTMFAANSGINTWDHEQYLGASFRIADPYMFKPARASYAPVLLGQVAIFSALTEGSNLALGIDPFFYLWNPYNRKLKVDRYAIKLTNFPGHITFWVTKAGTTQRYGPANISKYLSNHAGQGGSLSYLVSDLTMDPGEVIVVSPRSNRPSNASVFHDAAFPGTNTDNQSGAILTVLPKITGQVVDTNGNPTADSISWEQVPLDLTEDVGFLYSVHYAAKGSDGYVLGQQGMSEHVWMDASMPASNVTPLDLANSNLFGEHLQQIGNNAQGDNSVPEYFDPPRPGAGSELSAPTDTVAASTLVNTKRFFGISNYLTKPAAHEGDMPNPVEVFTQFNPFPVGGYGDMWRPCLLSQTFSAIADPGDVDALLQRAAINFPASSLENGYWGESYAGGSTSVPMLNIPSSPLLSLAAFSHANLTIGAHQPFRPVGNSWASLFVSPVSPYGQLIGMSWIQATASDSSWLLNDALFDRYYLSGIATDFTIGGVVSGSGYSPVGTLSDTLTDFFSADYQSAEANPVLAPYLPEGTTAAQAVAALAANDGYKKMGAYSLIDGVFNVNSTSVAAWEAFLRGNRNLSVDYAQGAGSNSASGAPFPSSTSPSAEGNGADTYWSGLSRLDNAQITTLATEIVEEVKLRGPFMSLSDFVNHRVGLPKNNATHYMGALQAAIEDANINASVKNGAGGIAPDYGAMSKYFPDPLPVGSRQTSTGIPTDITQADLLLPLAPRLTARSDTFRIRAYGEVRSEVGSEVTSQAVCEAVVQRIPEYVDPDTDPTNNEPWDEAFDPLSPSASALNTLNQQFGRRFKVVSFRWLASNEI